MASTSGDYSVHGGSCGSSASSASEDWTCVGSGKDPGASSKPLEKKVDDKSLPVLQGAASLYSMGQAQRREFYATQLTQLAAKAQLREGVNDLLDMDGCIEIGEISPICRTAARCVFPGQSNYAIKKMLMFTSRLPADYREGIVTALQPFLSNSEREESYDSFLAEVLLLPIGIEGVEDFLSVIEPFASLKLPLAKYSGIIALVMQTPEPRRALLVQATCQVIKEPVIYSTVEDVYKELSKLADEDCLDVAAWVERTCLEITGVNGRQSMLMLIPIFGKIPPSKREIDFAITKKFYCEQGRKKGFGELLMMVSSIPQDKVRAVLEASEPKINEKMRIGEVVDIIVEEVGKLNGD